MINMSLSKIHQDTQCFNSLMWSENGIMNANGQQATAPFVESKEGSILKLNKDQHIERHHVDDQRQQV